MSKHEVEVMKDAKYIKVDGEIYILSSAHREVYESARKYALEQSKRIAELEAALSQVSSACQLADFKCQTVLKIRQPLTPIPTDDM